MGGTNTIKFSTDTLLAAAWVYYFTLSNIWVDDDAGIADLPSPYNDIINIYATFEELEEVFAEPEDLYGLVTGYKWVVSDLATYTTKTKQMYKSVGEYAYVLDATLAYIPCKVLYDSGSGSVGLKMEEIGIGANYFELVEVEEQANVLIYKTGFVET